jgi:hypothetical protein
LILLDSAIVLKIIQPAFKDAAYVLQTACTW